jgi:hydroxymethylbilane synthase
MLAGRYYERDRPPKGANPRTPALQSAAPAAPAAIRIGTRGSPLALAQAAETRRLVATAAGTVPEAIEVLPIRTSGDRITDRPLIEAGGKGLFTKEIDEALLAGRIDLAVHSAKDMPTRLPQGILIAACLQRADPRDAFISVVAKTLADLPHGAVLGTSSLRRAALARHARPDLTITDLRGNVETRLKRLEEGRSQAIVLAHAGLIRLGLEGRVTSLLDLEAWPPAAGQGIIALLAREGDTATRALLAKIDHRPSSAAYSAERAFLAVLDGSCRTPIAGHASVDGDRLRFRGMIIKPDGSRAFDVSRTGAVEDAARIGREAGDELAARGGADFFAVA